MIQYYYSDGLAKHGPYALEELKKRKLSRNTMVWHHPMEKWLPAEQFPELQELFEGETTVEQIPGTPERPVQSSRLNPYDRMPRTWLVESILVTIFCCMPFGIAGIVNAARVETRFNNGDVEGARRSSHEAGKWTKIGFWVTLAFLLLYAVFIGIAVAFDHY
ncbi:CD225/dispanin family protein [Salinimicrobium xinjiangense]|uniref:CD225/dispanin family protein n=1 Tax=Salinimicrobium xinjiangense TaxID=438596 RepID=UPI000A05AF5B|nr:CD225/dispanin family protein [Salinimicrobium xinjiangense]